ncbi:MAG: glycosyltransferase [Myxococcota bacterium]|nr:glycosyltransferase [Myxococcota bacterium]
MDDRTHESPRILIGTLRRASPRVSRCGTVEFEDVVSRLDGVDLIDGRATPWPRQLAKAETVLPRAFRRWPAAGPTPGGYELFFVSVHSTRELCRFQPLSRFLDAARQSACSVDEVWAHGLADRTGEIAMLRRFDHLFTSCRGAVEALAELTGRPCHYLPPSLDTERFCPFDRNLERVIDVYFMGRHREALHDALRKVTADSGRFYLFDTSIPTAVFDAVEHRQRLAEFVGRSRYFVVDIAKADLAEHTGVQEEIGPRYFEAAAGGAIMIGVVPRNAEFEELFGWPESVVAIDDDPARIRALLEELDSSPERVEGMRRRNVAESMRRHDVAYRWRAILEALGMSPTPALAERVERLQLRAGEILRGPEHV